jgi:bifunctional UDP-N-acetylglucosamine pyrophosphorylase/glucosamine-1-phosphate N-acetyltransferase
MTLEVIILAAGQGTRMKSRLPKVLHPLGGRPLLQHVIDAARALEPAVCHVVVGHGGDRVRAALEQPGIRWVEQLEQHGTGHAVQQALPAVAPDSTVLCLFGDVPLIQPGTLAELVAAAAAGPALLTANVAEPAGYGRILRNGDGGFSGVVEHKDASAEQKRISEINTGVLALPAAQLLDWLPRVGNDNAQGEYYLPDVLGLAVAEGVDVATVICESEMETLGINDRAQLAVLEREYQRRCARQLMLSGVTLADPERIDVRGSLDCGSDSFIDANVVFEGRVKLGEGVRIGANCVVKNAEIGDDVEVLPLSHLEDVVIADGCTIGPFARLRPGTRLGSGARIGNFVETKNAQIGDGSKVNHLTYIGDCEMGERVNVGAGTITCNYDGANKHRTTMGDDVFIGSNSTLVAPLEISDGAFVGAGSTITRKVENGQLAVGRGRQKNLDGWQRPVKPDKGPGTD